MEQTGRENLFERTTRMKYFYDTEFIDGGKTIDLISIGIVAEDEREFYAEAIDADLSSANDWVKENVIPHLWSRQVDKREGNAWFRDGGKGGLLFKRDIANELVRFIGSKEIGWTACGDFEEESPKPEFWGYYSAYDHVALCQLFGTMMNLPKGWPMYTRDLKQLGDSLGNPELPRQDKDEHHALADARWNRDTYVWLMNYAKELIR